MDDHPMVRIICRKDEDYSLAIRGSNLVFALFDPCDRYQHWIKDERHGTTIKDSEGHPAFALVNKATGEAIKHCPNSKPVPLTPYDKDNCDESVLWTMSNDVLPGLRHIRRADDISVWFTARGHTVYDGHIIDLFSSPDDAENPIFLWKIVEVSSPACIARVRPSQQTVRIYCQSKLHCNLTVDKDSGIVMLAPSDPRDKYQHWIKETTYGAHVKDEEDKRAFALVNKATGKAIKHGFGKGYLVQLAPFNRNYLDASLLWTESDDLGQGFRKIRMQNNSSLALDAYDVNIALLGLWTSGGGLGQRWKIEDFE